MLKLDNNLLNEIGLGGLPEDQKKGMLQHIYETLELRVGTNLANQMTDQQLEEFEKFIDEGGDANQAQALQWLEGNLPNYKQVVNDVFEQLKAEISQMAPQIMASSQPVQPQIAQPVQQPQVPQQAAYQQQYQQPMPAVQPTNPTQQSYAQPQNYQPAPQGYQPPMQQATPMQNPPQPPQYPPQQAA